MTERSESERAELVALDPLEMLLDAARYAEGNGGKYRNLEWAKAARSAVAKARLAAAGEQKPDQEPVAWQWRYVGETNWKTPLGGRYPPKQPEHLRQIEARPLFAAPQPAPGWDEFKPTQEQINSACMSYRHDFGLLYPDAKTSLRAQAREWLYVWQKEYAYVRSSQSTSDAGGGVREALEHARMFIENGVELGYIKMPDADTPDPAHKTLSKIIAALATLSPPAGERREAIARLADSITTEVMRRRDKIITETNAEKRKPLMIEAADYVRNTLLASGLVQDEAGWQPISTAPKDGTRILWSCGDDKMSVIHWPEYDLCFEGGYWMPLPAPPIRSVRDGGAES